ncbi:unnamed protein product [Ectocarpus sp. CCAP 1310/34]|nr:unnamed protein product [Ectocarpus sp. CCAP 1310/34]
MYLACFLTLGGVMLSLAVRPAYYWLKSEKSRESTFTAMCTIALAMERLLNLRHREGTW